MRHVMADSALWAWYPHRASSLIQLPCIIGSTPAYHTGGSLVPPMRFPALPGERVPHSRVRALPMFPFVKWGDAFVECKANSSQVTENPTRVAARSFPPANERGTFRLFPRSVNVLQYYHTFQLLSTEIFQVFANYRFERSSNLFC